MDNPNEDATDEIGAAPRCATCGSERVVRDAWACFNPDSGLWELEQTLDDAHCHQCEQRTTLCWSEAEAPPHRRIRELNDQFRCNGLGHGSIMVTRSVQENGSDFVVSAVNAVRTFDAFTKENDPWGEHDFGAVQVSGETVFFKIDYYDLSLEHGSENPANAGITHRVLTIMLASEY